MNDQAKRWRRLFSRLRLLSSREPHRSTRQATSLAEEWVTRISQDMNDLGQDPSLSEAWFTHRAADLPSWLDSSYLPLAGLIGESIRVSLAHWRVVSKNGPRKENKTKTPQGYTSGTPGGGHPGRHQLSLAVAVRPLTTPRQGAVMQPTSGYSVPKNSLFWLRVF